MKKPTLKAVVAEVQPVVARADTAVKTYTATHVHIALAIAFVAGFILKMVF